ncbi:MAG: hypothetical protein JNN05_06200 [Candidatus Omnitrophica bacterium]|nr:hypothetical protein [Candidatus Omnitrophota bacterium]
MSKEKLEKKDAKIANVEKSVQETQETIKTVVDSAKSEKVYELLRNELTYEANLIAHRTSWFVASQAFFFTSLAAALNRDPNVAFTLKNSLLFPMIPWVSLTVCIVIFLSVVAAVVSADKVRHRLHDMVKTNPYAGAFVQRSKIAIILGLLPSFVLPLIFAACWIIILRG